MIEELKDQVRRLLELQARHFIWRLEDPRWHKQDLTNFDLLFASFRQSSVFVPVFASHILVRNSNVFNHRQKYKWIINCSTTLVLIISSQKKFVKFEIWHDAAKRLRAAQAMYESRTKSTLRRGSLFVPRRWEGKQDAIHGYPWWSWNFHETMKQGIIIYIVVINDTESYWYLVPTNWAEVWFSQSQLGQFCASYILEWSSFSHTI